MSNDERFAEINGARLHYKIDGAVGLPWVVLINSLATDLTMWEPQIAALTRTCRVLRSDARGHGKSRATPAPYTIDLLVDDTFGLMNHVGASRACVVGLSLGGLTAIAAGLRRDPRVAGIAVCDSRADMPPEFVTGIESRNRLAREQGMTPIAEQMVGRWFTRPTLDSDAGVVSMVRQMILTTTVEGFVGCAEAVKCSGLMERLEELTCPSLFLVGDADAAVPVEVQRAMQTRVAGSRFAVIAGAGHLSNIEQPDSFNAALLSFLRATP